MLARRVLCHLSCTTSPEYAIEKRGISAKTRGPMEIKLHSYRIQTSGCNTGVSLGDTHGKKKKKAP
jgi:hypothetical protein